MTTRVMKATWAAAMMMKGLSSDLGSGSIAPAWPAGMLVHNRFWHLQFVCSTGDQLSHLGSIQCQVLWRWLTCHYDRTSQ